MFRKLFQILIFQFCATAAFAQQECAAIESSLERLDCYDGFFQGESEELPPFPSVENMKTDLVGQRFYETNKSAGGARGWAIGRRGDIAKLFVTRSTVGDDYLEVEAEIHLGPSNGQHWVANVDILYVMFKGKWLLKSAGMVGNFRYLPA